MKSQILFIMINLTFQLNYLKTRMMVVLVILLTMVVEVAAQHEDKPRPEAWKDLVYGARFMDRILPAPIFNGLEIDT